MDSFPYVLMVALFTILGFMFGIGIGIGTQSQIPDINTQVCYQLYEKKKGYDNCLKRKDIAKNIGMIRSIDNDRI